MNFRDLLLLAQSQEAFAIHAIAQMYRPLLLKESIIDGCFDEDLYQELLITLMDCIRKFAFE